VASSTSLVALRSTAALRNTKKEWPSSDDRAVADDQAAGDDAVDDRAVLGLRIVEEPARGAADEAAVAARHPPVGDAQLEDPPALDQLALHRALAAAEPDLVDVIEQVARRRRLRVKSIIASRLASLLESDMPQPAFFTAVAQRTCSRGKK